nr:glycosyltransferase [Oceanipulchritudo coccoides]
MKSTENIEVIERWISAEELSRYQNTCGVHLCPSEMEGFGHYILEGLSVGSIVVTTDAAPMNELVDDSCGFCVHANHMGKSYMEDRWSVEPKALEACIEKIIGLPATELRKLGDSSRARFEKLNNSFPVNFKIAFNEV